MRSVPCGGALHGAKAGPFPLLRERGLGPALLPPPCPTTHPPTHPPTLRCASLVPAGFRAPPDAPRLRRAAAAAASALTRARRLLSQSMSPDPLCPAARQGGRLLRRPGRPARGPPVPPPQGSRTPPPPPPTTAACAQARMHTHSPPRPVPPLAAGPARARARAADPPLRAPAQLREDLPTGATPSKTDRPLPSVAPLPPFLAVLVSVIARGRPRGAQRQPTAREAVRTSKTPAP